MEHSEAKSNSGSILLVICLATTLTPFMGSAMNLALPIIAKEFSMNALALGWLVSIFLLVSAIFPVPLSKLADKIGRKKVFLYGVVLFLLSSMVCGFAYNGNMLFAGRLFQGLGASMMFATNIAIVTTIFPPQQRGKALGIITAVVYISISSGPFFGGLITHYWGWRSIFFVSVAISLIVLAGIYLVIKGEWIEAETGPFDWRGMILYGLGLSALLYGFSNLPFLEGILFLIGGLVLFAGFVLFENRQKYPVLNVKLFWENKIFGLASVSALINYSATFAISFLLSLYLQYIKGFTVQHAGMILIVQPAVQTLFSPLAGRWSDKVDARKLATLGMLLLVMGLLCMLFLNRTTSLFTIIGILMILGSGFGIFSAPNMNVIMGSVDKRFIGLASATTNTMRLTGQAISMGITMMVISIFVGKVKISADVLPQFMHSVHVTFIILAILCAIGVFISWNGVKIVRKL